MTIPLTLIKCGLLFIDRGVMMTISITIPLHSLLFIDCGVMMTMIVPLALVKCNLLFIAHCVIMTITISLTLIKCRIQTHKRFKITLFMWTKHYLRISEVIPFMKLQNNT